ncbi:hypothetical protein PISMIDRAFT_682093 [Pisolithus microcarpus 441]|uniref:Uncharacterized protein n=1 Tax=Pisolithus microcarpus 441 TaxID=765257 RepID=A0A0C9ZE01_9AGAM|nr:hypothetical protein PISMIDRAFT_682093 [Pisolithus microcarpus 441]
MGPAFNYCNEARDKPCIDPLIWWSACLTRYRFLLLGQGEIPEVQATTRELVIAVRYP